MKKQIRKKKLNIKKLVLLFMIIFITIFICIISNKSTTPFNISEIDSEYKVIKQDFNENYTGIGQEQVLNKDGYFTTFTTKNNKIYKEYKQNGNSSWANKSYWDGTMIENGCGITSIATILSGYNKNYTPEDLRKKYYPVLDNDTIPNELSSTFGINNSGFLYAETYFSNEHIMEHLNNDKPILICVWNKPTSNRWTTTSHYMALLATDNISMVYLSNPNGQKNDSKSSGWYDINEITPFIAKALYIYNE